MKLQKKLEAKREEHERLTRIRVAAPPAHTVDGQLQRYRDQRRQDAGDDTELPAIAETDDELEELETALETLETPPEESPPKMLRSKDYKPGHRVMPTKQKPTGELPWWARAPRDGITAVARGVTARQTSTELAASVPVQRITVDDVIARHLRREEEGFGPHAAAKRHRAARGRTPLESED